MAGNRSGTVRFLQSLEVPALDHAGVAFTLAGAGDVYLVSGGEHVRLYQVAYVVSVDVVEPELSESSLGGYVAFAKCPAIGFFTLWAFRSPKPICTAA